MVETGSILNSEILKAKEADELNHFISPKIFGGGKSFIEGFNLDKIDEAITLKDVIIKKLDDNFLVKGKLNYENFSY